MGGQSLGIFVAKSASIIFTSNIAVLTEPFQNPITSRNANVRVAKDAEVETLLHKAARNAALGEVEVWINLHHSCHARQASLGRVRDIDCTFVEVGGRLAEVGVVEVVVVAKGVIASTRQRQHVRMRSEERGCAPEASIVLDHVVRINVLQAERRGIGPYNAKRGGTQSDGNVASNVAELLESGLHHRHGDVTTVCWLLACIAKKLQGAYIC